MGIALFTTFLMTAAPASAQERWYLMARHGECFALEDMQRRIPELAEAKDPYAFVERMKQKGHAATTKDVIPGKAVEVRVPERELAIVFAKREMCQSVEKR
jgi:hypothetical protein